MHLITIATRCADVEGFRNLFARYIDPDDHALFVSSGNPPAVGTKIPFQIRLRDGTIILRGESEVVRCFGAEGDRGPWTRSGYCLKLSGLEPEAELLYEELVEAAGWVSEKARATVPPVAPEGLSELADMEPSPTAAAKSDPENSSELIMNALAGALDEPPPAAEPGHQLVTPEGPGTSDPVWGAVPPPRSTPAWLLTLTDRGRRWIGSLKRSRHTQLQAGAIGGVLIVAFVAVLSLGGDDETESLAPAINAVAAGMTPSRAEQMRGGVATSVSTATASPPPPAEPAARETSMTKTERSGSAVRPAKTVRKVKSSKTVTTRRKRTAHAWR